MIGTTLGHYAITEKIGAGGMGVVYKARDSHLDRFVAVKVLPAEKVADPEKKSRFMREARAASALNHPNIIHVYDIDQAGGTDFIAMEYVDGRTLDELVPPTGMRVEDALRCAIQVADALSAAHAAGIVHRDLKPANIMVTGSGLVKLLDFGLAKLVEPIESNDSMATRTIQAQTAEGTIIGTVAYMSPEQAEGKRIDVRSDIFSFGAVLYEMVTGRRAFRGDTHASTIAAILRDEPRPASQDSAAVPPELERVISRCLRKDPARRFQNMSDLKVALEELKEESASSAITAAPHRAARGRTLAWMAGGFVLALAIGAAAWLGLRQPRAGAGASPRVSAFATLDGMETGPALSPDGKQIAFVWDSEKRDNFDIYVQLVGEGTPRRLTSNPAYEYSPVWSPDALHIAFLRETDAGTEILTIPSAGGPERRLHVSAAGFRSGMRHMSRQFCGIAWSPDGRFLSIVDKELPQSPPGIFLFDIEARERKKLTSPLPGWRDGVSAFSPDGRTLAFARTPSGLPSDLYTLKLPAPGAAPGRPTQITDDKVIIGGFDWTPDGRAIVFASYRGGMPGLWRVAASGGRPERLPVGSENALWPSVSRRGDRLAYAQTVVDVNIWRVALQRAEKTAPSKVIYSAGYELCPVFSPDGKRVAFSSSRSGTPEIWICGSDGSNPRRLTSLHSEGALQPCWSPDGRNIAFWAEQKDGHHILLMDVDGGKMRRLTPGDFNEGFSSSWSRDGNWVYFRSDRGGGPRVWKAAVKGGDPVQVSQRDAARAFESFDGEFVYYEDAENQIWKVPVGGGDESPVLTHGRNALWTVAESGIYLLEPYASGGPAIEFHSFATGQRTRKVALSGEPVEYVWGSFGTISLSPDGEWLLYEHRDRWEADVILVDDFR